MDKKFPIHWLEDIVSEIEGRHSPEITLATGKTPSGHIHLGILREIIICDALRRIFEKKDKKINFYLFFDSLDAAKRFPNYIPQKFKKKHLGKPFALIPCPFEACGCESYANHFGNELVSTFDDFCIKNEIIWSHELYKEKKMQEKIRISLENTNKIKAILKKYILPTLDEQKKEQFTEMQNDWMPVMAICEKCDRIQFRKSDGTIFPNRIEDYNHEKQEVSYTCPACGHKANISIYSGRLKLNWRLDWPAKWSLFKTTCEPAGKDHCVKGGSYDTGLELCKEIFLYEGPVKVAYEWLRLGERDMKTSKGIVFTPNKYLEMADPEIFRTLILRTNPMKHISFRIEEIPQYYDYYEKMENVFYDLEEVDSDIEEKTLKYLYPLTTICEVSSEKPLRIPLSTLSFFSQVQNILSIEKLYAKAKELFGAERVEKSYNKKEFRDLLKKNLNWIDEVKLLIDQEKDQKRKRTIQRKVSIFSIPKKIDSSILSKLSEDQISALEIFRTFLIENENYDADLIQNKIFSIAKEELGISPKKVFTAFYHVLLGKKFGPRLGSFIELLDKDWLLGRLNLINENNN